ncbi:hypothetical protein BJX76DRAFT_364324 [Aspergillus varians]
MQTKQRLPQPRLRYGPDPNNHPDQKESSNIIDNMDQGAYGFESGIPAPYVIGEIEDMFRGSDGTKVPQEQWWKPGPSILPPPLTEEDKAYIKKLNEENKEIIQDNIQRKSGEVKPCEIVIRSDHDICPG